jgi:hypothetical protein
MRHRAPWSLASAAPGLRNSLVGVGHGEGRMANPFRSSPMREGRLGDDDELAAG